MLAVEIWIRLLKKWRKDAYVNELLTGKFNFSLMRLHSQRG